MSMTQYGYQTVGRQKYKPCPENVLRLKESLLEAITQCGFEIPREENPHFVSAIQNICEAASSDAKYELIAKAQKDLQDTWDAWIQADTELRSSIGSDKEVSGLEGYDLRPVMDILGAINREILKGKIIRRCNLRGTRCVANDLNGTRFEYSDLTKITFDQGVNLESTSFEGCILKKSTIHANVQKTFIYDCDCKDIHIGSYPEKLGWNLEKMVALNHRFPINYLILLQAHEQTAADERRYEKLLAEQRKTRRTVVVVGAVAVALILGARCYPSNSVPEFGTGSTSHTHEAPPLPTASLHSKSFEHTLEGR